MAGKLRTLLVLVAIGAAVVPARADFCFHGSTVPEPGSNNRFDWYFHFTRPRALVRVGKAATVVGWVTETHDNGTSIDAPTGMSGTTVGAGGVPLSNEATLLFYTGAYATTARLALFADPTPGEASLDVPGLFGVQPPQILDFPISPIDCATVPTQ
jgi:hypothetical protein